MTDELQFQNIFRYEKMTQVACFGHHALIDVQHQKFEQSSFSTQTAPWIWVITHEEWGRHEHGKFYLGPFRLRWT